MSLRPLFATVFCALLAACAAPRTTTTASPGETAEPGLPPVVQDANPTDGRCVQCGVVEHIERSAAPATTKDGEPALGGIVGGVLQDEKGRAPATAAGFEITVRLDNGSVVVVKQRALGGVRQGQRVEVVEGRAQPLLQ
jgi:hypothetical protein